MQNKKLNIIHYLLFVYCFFPFTFKPLRLLQVAIAYGGGFIYVLFNFKFLISKIRTKLVYNSFHVFMAIMIVLLLRPLYTGDYTYLGYFISFLRASILIFCMIIVLLKNGIDTFEEVAAIYINVMLIYIACSLLLLLPPLRALWTSIIYTNEKASELIESIVYYTRFGLQGFSGWSHTVHCSIGVALFWVLKLNGTNMSYIKFLLLLIGCALYGRSGLLVALVSSLIACIYAIKMRKTKYILFILLIGIILFAALLIYINYFSSEYNALSWMLEPFVNKLQGKKASSSSNELREMYQRFHIDGVKSLLFGDGLYMESGHYYQKVDIGWVRPLLFGGLFFLTIYYVSLLLSFHISINSCPRKIRYIYFILFITQLMVFEMKGETYLMFARVLLLFSFTIRGNTNDLSVCDQPIHDGRGRKSFLKYCFKSQ